MVSVKNLFLFITAASAFTLGRRDTATLTTDINTIDTDVNSLTSAVNTWTGGVLAAIPINTAVTTLETAINQGTTDAKASSTLSSADSATLIALINSKLAPDVQTSLQALVAKQALFASNGLTSLVQSSLATLKSDTDAFGAALIAITSSDEVSAADAALASIDSYFSTAITAFAS